jgi:IclR family mhp operon transcriptional activator
MAAPGLIESTRPIRALMRGLDALTVLNLRDGATVSEVALEVRLPRTTVYRILETLCDGGFVFRDSADDRYRLTVRVRQLRAGFVDEAWVTQIATPRIMELCDEIVWPVALATLSGTKMTVRETTDHATPLAIERYSAGYRLPLLGSASGRVYLACCTPAQRDELLELLSGSTEEEDRPARTHRADVLLMLADIRAQGYATLARTSRLVEELSLSVPVRAHERVLAALTVRFPASAVPQGTALTRFLPKLRECAAKIGDIFVAQADGAAAP